MDAELRLESVRSALSVRNLRLSFSIAMRKELQESCTVEQRRSLISIVEHVKEQHSNPAVVEQISGSGHRNSQDLKHFLNSKLAEREADTDQKLSLFQLKIRLKNFVFSLGMIVFEGRHRLSQPKSSSLSRKSCEELNFFLNSGVPRKLSKESIILRLTSWRLMFAELIVE